MTTTLAPFGCQPAFSNNGNLSPKPYPILSGYAANLLKWSPVKLDTDGTIIAAAGGDVDVIGIFVGVKYLDSTGFYQERDMWTTGTVGTQIQASVYDSADPNMVFNIQADGSLASSIGGQVDFSNTTAGSTVTGLSACTASASSLTTSGQNQLRIVGLGTQIGNAWGDAYTIIQVSFAQHQFIANKVAV